MKGLQRRKATLEREATSRRRINFADLERSRAGVEAAVSLGIQALQDLQDVRLELPPAFNAAEVLAEAQRVLPERLAQLAKRKADAEAARKHEDLVQELQARVGQARDGTADLQRELDELRRKGPDTSKAIDATA